MAVLYNKIDNLCKQNNITVAELCRQTKITRSVMSELSSGRTKDLTTKRAQIIADYFYVNIDFLSEDVTQTPCPLCGFSWDKNDPNEEKTHCKKHKLWDKAVKHYGFCWNYSYREFVKNRATHFIETELKKPQNEIDYNQCVTAFENIYKALFSRAVQAQNYNLTFSFEQYISACLANNVYQPNRNKQVFEMLAEKYGTDPADLDGTYLASVKTVQKETSRLSEESRLAEKIYEIVKSLPSDCHEEFLKHLQSAQELVLRSRNSNEED